MKMSDITDDDRSSAFQVLKPVCQCIVSDYKCGDITYLKSIVSTFERPLIQEFQSYILFPVKFVLLKECQENVTLCAVDFMAFVYERSTSNTWKDISHVISLLLSKINCVKKKNELSNCSEEMKTSVCLCLTSLLKSCTSEVLSHMFEDEFRLTLAQLIYTLTQMLPNEKSKKLCLTVLETISVIICCDLTSSSPLKDKASLALTCFFPGLSITLMKIVIGDFKQGNSVIRKSLEILKSLLVLIIGDQSPVEHTEVNNESLTDINGAPSVIRNETWFKEVSEKVLIIVQNTTVLQKNENCNVRLGYLMFAESLLLQCMQNLHNCISVLLPVVFALSVDDYEQVALCSQSLIKKFICHFEAKNSSTIHSIVEDGLYNSSSKLIKSKLSSNDDEKLLILRSILGYVQILDSSVNQSLFSLFQLEKLVMGLINLLELNVMVVGVMEEVSPALNASSVSQSWPKKNFCYFKKDSILTTVQSICYLLGKKGSSRLIIDYLLEKMQDSQLFILQCVILIGYVVEGLAEKSSSNTEAVELINDVVDTLLLLDNSTLDPSINSVDVYNSESKSRPMEFYDNNELYKMCFSLETIEKCAKVLKSSFKPFLINVLFYVVEKAGSSNYILSQTAQICLHSVSLSCGYCSVSNLLLDNADYLANSIVINSQNFLHRPAMAVVLRVAVEVGNVNVLKAFEDSIYHILNILDLNQEKAYSIMVVLKAVVISTKKWFPSQKQPETSTVQSETCSLVKYFQNLKAQEILIESSYLTDNLKDPELTADETGGEEAFSIDKTSLIDNEDNEILDDEASKETKEPWHIKMVSEILKRCIHLQSSNNIFLRVISLEVMESCIEALHDHPTQQHPLVHELWNPFIHRFSEDAVIVYQAFKVLLIIVDECQDFVRMRIMKDVMPKLLSFLKNSIAESSLKNFKNYQWSSSCKLLMILLSEMGYMLVKLDATKKDIALLTSVCLPYLNIKQPQIISQAACKTIKDLAVIDPDAMWMYYNELYAIRKTLVPLHKSLNVLNFPRACENDTNIKLIL